MTKDKLLSTLSLVYKTAASKSQLQEIRWGRLGFNEIHAIPVYKDS